MARPSLSSIIPAGNGDVLIRGLTSLGTFRRSSHRGFNRRKMEDQRREAAEKEAADNLGVLPHVVEATLNHVSNRSGVAGIYNVPLL